MARKEVNSDRFWLRPAEIMLDYLVDIKNLGTYGKTEQEVALNFIGRCIESLIKSGRIQPRTIPTPAPPEKKEDETI